MLLFAETQMSFKIALNAVAHLLTTLKQPQIVAYTFLSPKIISWLKVLKDWCKSCSFVFVNKMSLVKPSWKRSIKMLEFWSENKICSLPHSEGCLNQTKLKKDQSLFWWIYIFMPKNITSSIISQMQCWQNNSTLFHQTLFFKEK